MQTRLPARRAFLVQFGPLTDLEGGPVEGRAEHVRSGKSVHFRSLDELLGFLRRVLAPQGVPPR